jgi:hypothetical protein
MRTGAAWVVPCPLVPRDSLGSETSNMLVMKSETRLQEYLQARNTPKTSVSENVSLLSTGTRMPTAMSPRPLFRTVWDAAYARLSAVNRIDSVDTMEFWGVLVDVTVEDAGYEESMTA